MCQKCDEAARKYFPQATQRERFDILMNMTAFPFGSGEYTARQLRGVAKRIQANKNGWRNRLPAEMARQEEEMSAALEDCRRRYPESEDGSL